jgi:DNA-binding NtrC family response regulator
MIFVVEDDRVLRSSVVEYLRHARHDVEEFSDAESALASARESPPDLAICDLQLPGMGGLELMEKLGQLDGAIVRIAVTAHSSAKTAVRAIRSGCYEYLEKPVDLDRLERLVQRALHEKRQKRELAWLRGAPEGGPSAVDGILGDSEAVVNLRHQITAFAQLAADAPPVLIIGETGVGKGLAVRALHEARFSRDAPFIELNCAALPASLVEAELFGYERSAFTDAKQAKPGLFEVAGGGTMFLDEISEFSLEIQAKLLKVLESRSVRRLGSVRERSVSCAVVAAANVDLKQAAEAGRFRLDLFHRLAALTIRIPPLREREDDPVLLARKFAWEAAMQYRKRIERLSADTEHIVRSYAWPGNVRELRFAIERATILAPDGAVELPADTLVGLVGESPGARAGGSPSASLQVQDGQIRVDLPDDGIAFDDLEKAILQAALERTGGNVTHAARLLRIGRDQLRYRIRKYDLGDG